MKLQRLVSFLVIVLMVPSVAYAQATSAPATLPAVTLPVAVTMLLSVLLGFVNMAVAQGSILGVVVVPKTWLPDLTIVSTLLGGIGSFLASAPTPWTGGTAFYALTAGLGCLLGGALPAFAAHAHKVVPAQLVSLQKQAAQSADTVPTKLG